MDVFSDCLQGSEVLDVVDGISSLGKESLVDDDTEALIGVADGAELAVLVIEIISICAEFSCNWCTCQVETEFSP